MKKFCMLQKGFLVFSCCLLLCACGKEEGKETKGGEINQEQDGSAGGISPAPTGEGGFSQKIDGDGAMGDALPLAGKALGELQKAGEEDAVYCNLPENVTAWESIVPLCVDPLYGILYYVDYGGDYMIHAIYQGEAQTVVELPGKRLFCRGGKLYFLLDSYNRFRFDGAKSGNIAEYNPVTGEVRVISERQFDSIVVYQDLIYCMREGVGTEYGEKEGELVIPEIEYWFYFFGTDEWKQREDTVEYVLGFQRYKDYFLAASLTPLEGQPNFSTRTGMEERKWNGEQGTVWDGFMPALDFYVKGEQIQWIDQQGFHIREIADGQEQLYFSQEGARGQCILVNGQLFGASNWLADLENETMEHWSSMDEKLKKVHEFYTDGEAVYVVVGLSQSMPEKNSVLRKVQVVAQGGQRIDLTQQKLVTETGFQFLTMEGVMENEGEAQ